MATVGAFPFLAATVLLTAACGGPLGPKASGPRAPLSGPAAKVDALVDDYLKDHPVVGLGLAVRWRGETILAKGYGFADREAGVAVDANTVFAIGSMTKQFTAAAVLQLVDAGKFTLDTDVRELLPDAHLARGPLTIRQLLSHTSGLPEYMPSSPSEADLIFSPVSQAALVKRYAASPREFAAGTNWGYSNSNFQLLALVVEKVSGLTFEQYLRDHVFAPAGLTNAYVCDHLPEGAPMAKGYAVDPTGKASPERDVNWDWAFGAGNICATASDVLTWNAALQAGRVVSPSSLAVMETAVHLDDGTPTTYSTGLFVDDVQGHRHVEHAGDTLTFYSDMAFYPDDDLAIVFSANTEGARFDRFGLERSIARAVLSLPEPSVESHDLPADLGQALSGTYSAPGRGVGPRPMTFSVQSGKLVLKDGSRSTPLSFQGGRRFVVAPSPQSSFTFAGEAAPFVSLFQYEMMVGRAIRSR